MRFDIEFYSGRTGDSYRFEVDLGDASLSLEVKRGIEQAEPTVLFDRSFDSWQALEHEYERQFESLLREHEDLRDFDNREIEKPYSLRKLAAAQAAELLAFSKLKKAPPPPRSPKLVDTEALLLAMRLTDAQKAKLHQATSLALADAFELVMVLEPADGECPVGASALGGVPDLPNGVKAPRGLTFLAQIQVSDVAPADVRDRFLNKGWVYVFVDESGFGQALYTTKKPSRGAGRAPQARLSFERRFVFDGYEAAPRVLPASVVAGLKAIWGDDVEPLTVMNESRAFGPPFDAQATGDPFAVGPSDETALHVAWRLLAQFEHGGGLVLVGFREDDPKQLRVVFTGT